MLALSRKINQSIILNDNIEVTILEIKGDQIKIGIDAPKSVPIYRKEIYLKYHDRKILTMIKHKVEQYIEMNEGYSTVHVLFDME